MQNSSQEIKWFVQQEGQIQGPLSNENLQNKLEQLDSRKLEQTLVWRRGFIEWMRASKWHVDEHTKTINIPNTQFTQALVSPSAEITVAEPTQNLTKTSVAAAEATTQEAVFYRVQINFVDQPMMTKKELLTLISKQEDVSVIAIQDPKTKDWRDVYSFPDIIENLGLSRRKHHRVPILAQFNGKSTHNESFLARIITISEGGIGFTEVFDLKIGDEVEGLMISPHFFQPIHIKAEVVYSGLDGYIGLNYKDLNDEAHASILDYLKKFGKSNTGTP